MKVAGLPQLLLPEREPVFSYLFIFPSYSFIFSSYFIISPPCHLLILHISSEFGSKRRRRGKGEQISRRDLANIISISEVEVWISPSPTETYDWSEFSSQRPVIGRCFPHGGLWLIGIFPTEACDRSELNVTRTRTEFLRRPLVPKGKAGSPPRH